MAQSQPDNMFSVLLESLQEFRIQVEGESGDQVAAIGDSPDVIPELLRGVLGGMGDSLDWLYSSVFTLEQHVRTADAALAAIEVMRDVVEPATRGLSLAGLSDGLGLSSDIATALDSPLNIGRQAFGAMDEIGAVLPRPEDIAAIKDELEHLLGTPSAPQEGKPGSFAQLLSSVGVESG